MEAAYIKEGGLESIPAYIDDTGEVNWLVGDATRMEVAVPVILWYGENFCPGRIILPEVLAQRMEECSHDTRLG
jgi:hypothetical protein